MKYMIERARNADAEELLETSLVEDMADALERLQAERDAAQKDAGEISFKWAEVEKERDALQEQVKMLRAALLASDSWYRSHANLHHKDVEKQISETLAATEPKEKT